MSLLAQVCKPEPRPRRVMLYGTEGIGKSTWASHAPRAVFLPTEDGFRNIANVKAFPMLTSYGMFQQAVRELISGQHDFGSAVMDSADWLEMRMIDHVCLSAGKQSLADFDYGKGPDKLVALWQELFSDLDLLGQRMNIFILAHSKIEQVKQPDSNTYDRYAPDLHKRTCPMVMEWCDEVLFAQPIVYTSAVGKNAKSPERYRATGGAERIVRTTGHAAYAAKNRLSLPEDLPLEFDAYWQYVEASFGHDNTPLDKEAAEVFKV